MQEINKTSNVTLFITDDDFDDREFLSKSLIENGFYGNIENLQNGAELLQRLQTTPPKANDILILDLNMPIVDGYDVLKIIKTDSELKNLCVIVLSATSKIDDEAFCLSLGCNSFLSKPLSYSGYQAVSTFILDKINNLSS